MVIILSQFSYLQRKGAKVRAAQVLRPEALDVKLRRCNNGAWALAIVSDKTQPRVDGREIDQLIVELVNKHDFKPETICKKMTRCGELNLLLGIRLGAVKEQEAHHARRQVLTAISSHRVFRTEKLPSPHKRRLQQAPAFAAA
jgi:hypothetical protein